MIPEELRNNQAFRPTYTAPTGVLEQHLVEFITMDTEALVQRWNDDPHKEWMRRKGIHPYDALLQEMNSLMAELYRRAVCDGLTEQEKDVTLNALEYMVQNGLTSFEMNLYRSSFEKIKRPSDKSFDDILKELE